MFFCVHLLVDQPQTGASGVVHQGRRHGPFITYKITPCWVTLLQPVRRAAMLGQPSSLRSHWSPPLPHQQTWVELSTFHHGALPFRPLLTAEKTPPPFPCLNILPGHSNSDVPRFSLYNQLSVCAPAKSAMPRLYLPLYVLLFSAHDLLSVWE